MGLFRLTVGWLRLSNDIAVELASRLKLPVDAIEGFLSFLVNHYLVKYPSVSVRTRAWVCLGSPLIINSKPRPF